MRLTLLSLLILACEPVDDASSCERVTDRECSQGSGGPPVDVCRQVGGEDRCVYLCDTDDDCLDDFYPAGCVGVADDGSAICA